MSRRIARYVDGKAQWEDLGPAIDVQWGAHIGGRAIEERSTASDRAAAAQKKYREGRKRGENLR